MARLIDPKERKTLIARIENLEIVDLQEVEEIIRPYIDLDYERALSQVTRRVAKSIIASIKDDKGIRKYFSCGQSEFINVENTESLPLLMTVQTQLAKKLRGLNRASNKVKKHTKRVAEGQVGMFEVI